MRLAIIAAALLPFLSSTALAGNDRSRPEVIVRGFIAEVRSGRDPDLAGKYLADRVLAHQITSEGETTIERTPAEYAAHVREFAAAFGAFRLTLEQLVAQRDLVFVRWKQQGLHLQSLSGEAPTGGPLIEITSVVYRVQKGRIVEYWLQTDRKGMEIQLERLVGNEKGNPSSP